MSTAGEGGPWGMAVLAIFARRNNNGQSLEDFLDHEVFVDPESMTLSPEPEGVEGYNKFISRYEAGLPVESEAIKTIKEEKRNE